MNSEIGNNEVNEVRNQSAENFRNIKPEKEMTSQEAADFGKTNSMIRRNRQTLGKMNLSKKQEQKSIMMITAPNTVREILCCRIQSMKSEAISMKPMIKDE